MKAMKYILVFGLPAVVCGVGWCGMLLGITRVLKDGPRRPDEGQFELILLGFCLLAAPCSFFVVNRIQSFTAKRWPGLLWASIHALMGAGIFGMCFMEALLFSFPEAAANPNPIKIALALPAGLLCGLFYGIVLLPLQIIPAYLHLRLFRFLHARFLAPKAQKEAA